MDFRSRSLSLDKQSSDAFISSMFYACLAALDFFIVERSRRKSRKEKYQSHYEEALVRGKQKIKIKRMCGYQRKLFL